MALLAFHLYVLLALLLISYPVVSAAGKVAEICQQLSNNSADVTTQDDSNYETLRTENWVETAWGEPVCIISPSSVQEVQAAVNLIVGSNASFAVRSGGHSPHHGFANIDGGVLIDMSGLNGTNYEAEKSIVTVGPGLRWGELYTYLEQQGVTAVGGRVMDVGVGGLVLGGGLSWLTDLYGLACDNVVNFQVVLANGSVVNANSTANTDLFRALKGGSNNFGVVTELTLSTYPIGQVWGGIRTYTNEQFPEILDAYTAYLSVPDKDPYANLHVLVSPTNDTIGIIVSLVYLKPEADPAVFEPFNSINATSDSTDIKNYTAYMGEYGIPEVQRFDWFTMSFKFDETLHNKVADIITTSPAVDTLQSVTAGFMGITWQPISKDVAALGQARGGNSLGLEAVAQTWLAEALGWWWPDDDVTVHNAGNNLTGQVEAASIAADGKVLYEFMNDASWSQQVLSSYGEDNVKQLRAVQTKYDPGLVFEQLVPGGFKIPTAS